MSMQRATIRSHVTSDEAKGGLALIEYTVPPYFLGPARHQHPQMTMAWYVLDGMLAFTLDECTITAPRGTCVLIPPGTFLTFFNPTVAPATLLLWCAPGGRPSCCLELDEA